MYYSYKSIGDVLIIIFNNSLPMTKSERVGHVEVIYHDSEIIGYNIFDIKEIVKIKNEGMIYYPSETFLNIINSILINAHLSPLEKKDKSGYLVSEITDIKVLEKKRSLITLRTEKETFKSVTSDSTLEVGDKVVVAIIDTFLNNGEIIKEMDVDGARITAHICTNYELGIKEGEERILLLDKDETIGEDFYKPEA